MDFFAVAAVTKRYRPGPRQYSLQCNIERDAGNVVTARACGEQALALARQLEHPWATASVLKDLGDLHLGAGDGRAAGRAFDEAARLYASLGAESRAEAMHRRVRAASGTVA